MTLPLPAFASLVSLASLASLVSLVLLPLSGGVAGAQRPDTLAGVSLDTAARAARVERGLVPPVQVRGRAYAPAMIEARMQALGVPAVSVAVIDGGRIAWARAYGLADVAAQRPATPATLFQAASMSKPVAATAALQLVAEERLALDESVNERLTSWKVPANAFTAQRQVTLRDLLTHSAGLTVHGFPGYAAGSAVPTVVQLLDGAPPANTAAVRVDREPGAAFRYSGGGTTVVQLLLTDVTGESFHELMRQRVLAPAGMTASTFEQPLPPSRAGEAATAYRADGRPIDGNYHTYPEMAAAGLWATPTDLARWIIAVQRSLAGAPDGILTPAMAAAMVTPGVGGWGLGVALEGAGDTLRFAHGGANAGFRGTFAGFARGGQGAVVMTNSDAGGALAAEVIHAVAAEYGWPGYSVQEIVPVATTAEALRAYAGEYALAGTQIRVAVTAQDAHLVATQSGGRPFELIPTGPDTFTPATGGAPTRFERGDDGRVTALVAGSSRLERVPHTQPPTIETRGPDTPASAAAHGARVDSIFARFDRRDAPGCAVAVARAGTAVYLRGYGMADLENDVPITPSTAFYLASVSKQFAAYSVILLARDGTLSLDDPVRKFFPELHDLASQYGTPITVRHLLHHSSGLRDYFALLALSGWPGDGPVTERDFLDLVGRQRTLNFAPGTQHLYSNTGYVLLSILVERASGKSLREFAAARIFEPLGMASSVVRDDHTMLVKRRASAYVPADSGAWRTSVPGFDVVGDGGVYSTIADLVKWDGNFYEPRAGDHQALALLQQRGVLASGDTIAYAGGLSHGRARGLRTISHGGAYGGYRTMLLRFPEQRFSVAVLCNNGSANSSRLAHGVAEVYLGPEMAPVAAQAVAAAPTSTTTPPDAQLARYAGLYWDEQNEARLTITHTSGTLTLAGSGPPIELRHLGGVHFEAPSSGIKLAFGDQRVVVTSGDSRPTTYDAVGSAPPPTTAELQALAGRYTSEEADATVDIRVVNGMLEVSGRRLRPIALAHLFGSTFTGGPAIVRFVREGEAVTGLTISNGRSRGVPFERGSP